MNRIALKYLGTLALASSVGVNAHAAKVASNQFNPAMSLILSGTYANVEHDPESYQITGFPLAEETGPGAEGFSLGESELVISGNVDDQFYGSFTGALTSEGTVEIEEAFIETTSLGSGATLRAGRTFSGIGYLNAQHAHVWDFVDQPLVYRAMLGNQYNDDGIQLRWVAPTDLFVELGGEMFRGEGFPAGGAANNGKGAYSVFAHIGGDLNPSHSWRAGISRLTAKADARATGDTPDVFTGETELTVVDLVWKWAPNGNNAHTNAKLQGEWIKRSEDGTFNDIEYDGKAAGWYVQGIYQFMPRWRVGLRHDRMESDPVSDDLVGTSVDAAGHTPKRNSVMVDFANSEFSRIRVQFNRDESTTQSDKQVYVQYQMSIGAHGAHRF